jgi:hypothetical protein
VSDKKITPLGWLILERLAEMKLTRKQFCQLHDIPESRFSNIVTGLRPAKRYKDKIIRILNLEAPGNEHE